MIKSNCLKYIFFKLRHINVSRFYRNSYSLCNTRYIWIFTNKLLCTFNFNFKSALLLGIFQSIAILPGISRSGMVISSALMLGLNKEKSIQYCFFMVIPVIILSIFYELLFSSGFDAINLLDGVGLFLSSFIFGYLSLYFLVAFLKKFDFWWFGLYCITVSYTHLTLPTMS